MKAGHLKKTWVHDAEVFGMKNGADKSFKIQHEDDITKSKQPRQLLHLIMHKSYLLKYGDTWESLGNDRKIP